MVLKKKSLIKLYYIIQSSAAFILIIIINDSSTWLVKPIYFIHFCGLYNISFCDCAIIYLSILLSKDICAVSNLLLLWVFLKHFLVHMCDSFSMVYNYMQNYYVGICAHLYKKMQIIFQYYCYQFICFSPVMYKI